jgi:hypothetical protein
MQLISSNVPTLRGRFEPAEGAEAKRDQLIDIVTSRMQLSESYFSGIRSRLPRLYDLWRGTWSGTYHPHKNNVHIPLISSAIWADAARKAATSLSEWPVVSFLGYNATNGAIARKHEALISAQMKDDDLFQKQVDLILMADLYGVAIEQIGWNRKEEMRILEKIEHAPLTKQIVKTIKKGNIVTFDGPTAENIDLLDFFPQPGVKRIENMKWVVKRYYLDIDDLRAMGAAGVFDKAEIARLEREGATGARTQDPATIRRFSSRLSMDEDTVRWMDKYNTPIEILEMWGVVPSELAGDGVLSRVLTTANRRYLLRNRPNPFWHGQLPFLQFSPMPDPHYFFACGKAEIIEKLQITGNRFLNQSLDAAELIIDPVFFYNRESNMNTRNMLMRPGAFFPVDGNPNQVVAALQPNLNALTMADMKINQVRDFAQMGTGITEDGIAGIGGDGRQTAREFIGRREAAGTRLALESRLYEETLLEKHANMMMSLNKQFLEMPVEVTVLGDIALTDPATGEPIPATQVDLDYFDMMHNYNARATGASTTLSKMTRQQSYIQLLQAMASPLGQSVIGNINAVNFFKGIFRDFDVPNINEIFKTNDQLQQMVNQAGFQQAGQVPTSPELAQNPLMAMLAGAGGGAPPAGPEGAAPPGMVGDSGANPAVGIPGMPGMGAAPEEAQAQMMLPPM